MKKIKVFLADLTHSDICIATEYVPLNIGFIASFAQKKFGEKVEFRLFKYPEKLLDALKKDKPDILAVSNYSWNTNLAGWVCRKARALHKDILTVRGGWNFPMDNENRLDFLLRYPDTDIYVLHEGELSFAEILERYIAGGRAGVLSEPVKGCVFVDRSTSAPRLITGQPMPRIEHLDGIPSPYRSGMMDEFLDGELIPIVEMTRGCPFTCNFCNSAIPYYSVVRSFSVDYIFQDLQYICKKMKGVSNELLIPDSNFGMYDQDEVLAKKIAEMMEREGWPQSILLVGSGKRNMDKVLSALRPISKILSPSLAFQSLNQKTLREIKRINIATDSFKALTEKAKPLGFTVHSELIAPLPYETLDSYWEGMRTLINCDPLKITSYTLQMNWGTVYRQKEYREKHGIVGKYRLVPNDFGTYDGELVFEWEMAAVSTKYFSFADYLAIRSFTLYTELIYNNNIFREALEHVGEYGYTIYDFMSTVREEFPKSGRPLSDVLKSFIHDTKFELKDSEEDLVRFYSSPSNYKKLKDGKIGRNVIFKHKELVFCSYRDDLVDFVTHCVKVLLANKGLDREDEAMIGCVHRFCKAKLFDIFDDVAINKAVVFEGDYDVLAWMNDSEGRPLKDFNKKTVLFFEYTETQKEIKRINIARYGKTTLGRTKVLAKTPLMQSLFRVPSRTSSNKKEPILL